MLVLSRKAGETIVVGDNVRITVVRVVGNRVYLGLEAPREIPIDRLEIAKAKREAVEHEMAAG